MKDSYGFFLIILFLQIIPLCAIANTNHTNNAVKLGKAELWVEIMVLGDPSDPVDFDSIVSQLDIYGATTSIFSKNNDEILIQLKKDKGGIFYGEIPVDRIEMIGGVRMYCGGYFSGGSLIVLNQNEPTTLRLFLTRDGKVHNASYYGASGGLNMSEWMDIATISVSSASTNPFKYLPKDKTLYRKSWEAVREYQQDSIWPRYFSECTSQAKIPKGAENWVKNSLKSTFASRCIVPYVYNAESLAGIKIDEPPMSSYNFLDSIDYSPNVFLLYPTAIPNRWLLYDMLRFIDGGLEDIGERPVKEWKEYMDRKLAPAMEERPKLLLDLLAGMSYVRQLEEEKPLTPIQIENINEGFTDDIGKIVLARNEALVARLEKKEKAELRNMTDEAFDLKKFIDENYKGRPVVVDLWNTWCSPCLEAISQSEETKQEFAGSDLVFLYVADDSSPEDEWSRKAEEIGSKQVRVSTDTSAAILKSHNLEGFPSYLFFDRDHNLVHSRTAFPGTRRFRELLMELNPRK